MADPGRRYVRLAIVMALLVVGLVEVHAVLQSVRSQRRLRDGVLGYAREKAMEALPLIRVALAKGGPEAWNDAAGLALELAAASEAEVFDRSGRNLFSRPTVPPVAHWPAAAELEAADRNGVLTLPVQSGPAARALTYVPFEESGRPLLLRLSRAVPDLEEDLRERRQEFMVRLMAFSLLGLAAGLTLLPERPRPDAPAPHVLGAYEQAMGRLRDHGDEMNREHAAERRRMEDELREKAAMARAGELTAGIVHEARNGLGTILGYARLLERGSGGPEAVDAARSIRRECETLEVVIRRFTDYVKQDALNLTSLDVGRLLSRVVARESQGEGAQIALAVKAESPVIMADEEMLERAFENLIRNAREAAGRRGRVTIKVSREEHVLAIDIEDDGPGLPAEIRADPRPFFTTKPGGLGLGLPLAHKIVRLHGGALSLRDAAPRGAVAHVRLPILGPKADPSVTIGSGRTGGDPDDGTLAGDV